MPNVTIRIHGLDDALRAIGRARAEIVPVAAKAAALATIASAKPYPAQSRKGQPFVSSAQRRAFFAKLRSGAIQVPYQRTGALQDAWQYGLDGDGATVSNQHPHAAFVYMPQTGYHKSTWPNEQALADRAATPARDAAEQALVELAAGLP